MSQDNSSDPASIAERKRIASLFAQSPISMAILLGPEHVFEFANSSYETLVGRKNLLGKSVAQALPEIADQGFINILNQVFAKGGRFEAHETFAVLNGTEFYLDFSYDPLLDSKNSVIGILVTAVDVTLQIQARQALEKAKLKLEVERKNFRELFNESNEIIAVMAGPEHRFEFVNRAHIRLLGKDVTGMTAIEARPEAQDVIKVLDQVYQTGKPVHLTEVAIPLNNETRFFDLLYSPRFGSDGKVDGVMALVSDITEKTYVRKGLEREQDWLELILNRLPSLVLLVEPCTGRILFANEVAKKIYGSDIAERPPKDRYNEIFTLTDGNGKPLTWEQAPSARASRGEAVQDEEVILTNKSGRFHLVVSADMLPAIGSRPASHLMFAQDITAIKKAESEKREASRQVENERHKLRQIFEQAPVGITIVQGPEYIFELVNDSYRRMFTDLQKQFIGRKFVDVFPEIKNQEALEVMNRTYKTGEPFHAIGMPTMIRNELGVLERRYYDFLMQPLFETNGRIERLLTVVIDVTAQVAAKNSMESQQKQLQESEGRFRQLADSMPQIVWTAKPNGVLNYTNRRWTEYSGSSDPEVWLDFVHPEEKDSAIQSWTQSIKAGTPYETEFRLLRKIDKTYRWHLVRAVQIFDSKGQVANWFGTCTDIQDQKESQAEISAAKATAEAANSAKTAFLANMSHEIRTPLGAILGFTDLLRNSNIGIQEKNYLDVIIRNSESLTRVIDDILDISKIEAGKMDIEKISFSPQKILNEVLDLFREKANTKGIYVALNVGSNLPAEIISDPSRLRQILMNVIGNAVKFTEKGGINVSATAQTLPNSQIKINIQVKDTGLGLDPLQADKLFQPFTQAESGTNRKFGGTGLGLVISRKLAQALGGQLRLVDGAVGAGCTFEIEIRATVPEKKEVIAKPAAKLRPERLKGVRILGVDDSPDNRMLLKSFLKRESAEYEEADSGEAALAKISNGNFDVVLMDIQMPGIDGYEAVRLLRQQGYRKPIIALTAHAMAEERRRTLSSGFDDHVTKPIDSNLLVEAILRLKS